MIKGSLYNTWTLKLKTWTLYTVELQRQITAVKMRCTDDSWGYCYTEHVTNNEVRRRIEEHIGLFVDLLTAVKRRKLK